MVVAPIENNAAHFYDDLATDYDAMTGFDKRFIVERPFFRMLVEQNGIKTAVDAGCGTGFHSLALSQLGVSVTAVDVSPEMIRRTIQHANELGITIETLQSGFTSLPDVLHKRYDAVFCLGNTLPHLLSSDAIRTTLTSFAGLLKDEGTLFIQILNYDRILTERERVQSIKEVGTTTFVRFYDYDDELLRFNILRLEKKTGAIQHSLNSILLRPIRSVDVRALLNECGFDQVSFYGGISMEKFIPEQSKDLFIIARIGQ
jgi:glycine/sarcosine N-methyltransferase